MERISFVREQLVLLTTNNLLDLVMMISYELGSRLGILPPGPREKYDELRTVIADWEEE